uniref:Uncharacterized protein n=1 Tax=Rhizophora mucronata TaxID=61149 RepID=A0A2P2QZ12_RHIMU
MQNNNNNNFIGSIIRIYNANHAELQISQPNSL